MKNAYSNVVAGFTKLFSTIVHSTVWREEMHVKVVWVTMLALADRNGYVAASLPGLADASRVTMEQCEDALTRLSAPDKHSRTKEHEGRRIAEVDGGWALLNYTKYREQRDKDERRIKGRKYVADFRARKKADALTVSESKHIAEAEAEADNGGTASLTSQAETAFQRLRSIVEHSDLRHITPDALAWMGKRDKAGLKRVGGLEAIKKKAPEHLRFMQGDFVEAYLK